uniref:uncharacterized protein C17orf80 homolog n=1 Tax=Euleptes europaea TaxID=460621 RepID=UPI0025410538|nr:uncharacterized protein C17orf80 homolog [Euleptes europaea]
MTSISAVVEICPYCKKPFKRLKSHLPHCKMAGDALSAVNSSEVSSVPVTGNSATPECLNTKKKGQIKSTEMASKKENKKIKPKLIRNEGKVKSNSVEPIEMAGLAPVSNQLTPRPDEDIQQRIKHSAEKSQKRENGTPRAPGEDLAHAQEAEIVLSKTTLSKKPPRVQKSRSKITSDEEKSVSGIIQEPLTQTGKSTSKYPGQLIKETSAKQGQPKEGSAKQSVSAWVDSSMDDLQAIPQGVNDKVELVIDNHHVRVLRKRCDTSVQNSPLNKGAIGNNKMGHQPVESFSASAEIPLATEKPIITGKENRKRVLGLELEGDTLNGETGNAVSTFKDSDDRFLNSHRTVADVPVQLASGVKSMMDENQSSVISHKESLVYHNPKLNPYLTFTETLQIRGNDDISNCYLTSLEKDITLDSGTFGITRGNSSGLSLKPPSVHMLEMTAAQRSSSPKRGLPPGSLGLEWFPELYPNYQSVFSRKQNQWDTRISKTEVTILPHEGEGIPLAERSLMDAKLRDLPAWLATCKPFPRGMLRATCRAWNGYYNRYINVKKGGVAGISMLLLGYCVLSYAWSYKHIKQNRWRKYH